MNAFTRYATPLLVLGAMCADAQASTRDADDDANITRQVHDAIFHRADLAANDISVQTRAGVVYLHGLVDTNVQRSMLEDIVKATPGVRRVVDSIEMRNSVR